MIRAATAVLCLLAVRLPAGSQELPTTILNASGCVPGTDYEASGYRVRTARVEHPFPFLHWLRTPLGAANTIAARLAERPYTSAAMLVARDEIEELGFLPDFGEQRVRVRLVIVAVENCAGNELDVVYRIYSSRFLPAFGATVESRKVELSAPQKTVGVEAGAPPRFRLTPFARYNASERFAAGGRAVVSLPGATELLVEGIGSQHTRLVNAAVRGSVAQAEWRVDYLSRSQPVRLAGGALRQARLAAQFSAESKPLNEAALTVRFGGLVEGGSYGALAGLSGSGYGSVKLQAGMSLRGDHQVFSSSYGVETGSLLAGSGVDWHKHIADVAHDFWWPLGDHRPVELESRFTAGVLRASRDVPGPVAFFGGNLEQPFLPGDSWNIRANPVIRGIAANRLTLADGRGGRSFSAYNLTAGYAVWRKPIVPAEITRDSAFLGELKAQLNSAESLLAAINLEKNPQVAEATAHAPALVAALDNLKQRVTSAPESAACVQALNRAIRRGNQVTPANREQHFGLIQALLASLGSLGACPADSGIVEAGAQLQARFQRVDPRDAERRARNELAPARRSLTTILEEMNLLSVSPLLVFDVARLGSQGARVSVGGGVRFALVSHVLIDIGYARVQRRLPGDDRGAVFFSLRFRDLIR